MSKAEIPWDKVDAPQSQPTDEKHEYEVAREVIPLIFVPGIMGTRLRAAGSKDMVDEDGPDGLPNLRWDPGSAGFMVKKFVLRGPKHRKQMLIGKAFSPTYLEVDDKPPAGGSLGDGFHGLMTDYCEKFLQPILRDRDWAGPLKKLFVFPVYAFGYNWTDDNRSNGEKLAARIDAILEEGKGVEGPCERVILITHSMGGIVARAACKLSRAEGKVLGIVHGVQPVLGAAAAYWRIKAGFEHSLELSVASIKGRIGVWALGDTGPKVTPLLANSPGGLQLLPTKDYKTNAGSKQWLRVTHDGKELRALPESDPYREIYRVPAQVRPRDDAEPPSGNTYWGLVDPALLDPDSDKPPNPGELNKIDGATPPTESWLGYLKQLQAAEDFHDALGLQAHKETFCLAGIGHTTADAIELKVESRLATWDNYPTRGFRGFFRGRDDRAWMPGDGRDMMAVLQDPAGIGDATVSKASAQALNNSERRKPGDDAVPVEHQPAYQDGPVQEWALQAIQSLVRLRYEEKRGELK